MLDFFHRNFNPANTTYVCMSRLRTRAMYHTVRSKAMVSHVNHRSPKLSRLRIAFSDVLSGCIRTRSIYKADHKVLWF